MPAARALDGLPIATRQAARRCRRSRATPSRATATPTARSARATSSRSRRPCSASPASSTSRSRASRPSCCRAIRTSTTSSASSTPTAAASRSTRPMRVIPIRTLRNISLNPNFGGEVMVVSLGCEKLQPERLLPPGTFPIARRARRRRRRALDVVCLQDEAHVGFMSMIDSIMAPAEQHLERLNARRRETVPAQRARRRRAVRRQRRVLRRHRQSGGRLLHRPAGARRRDRDVLARSPKCATASTS